MALSVVVVLIREADNLFQVASVFLIVTQLEEFQEDAFYNSSVKLNVQLQQVNNRSVDLDLEDFFRLFALRACILTFGLSRLRLNVQNLLSYFLVRGRSNLPDELGCVSGWSWYRLPYGRTARESRRIINGGVTGVA